MESIKKSGQFWVDTSQNSTRKWLRRDRYETHRTQIRGSV